MAEHEIFEISRGTGGNAGGGHGGGNRPVPGVPPPPPPVPRAPGVAPGGPQPPPRPMASQVNPQQRMPPPQTMPMQQFPPMPPRDIIPPRFQQRAVEISDIRHERMTERQVRDQLSEFAIFRFEKTQAEDGLDLDGRALKPNWMKVVRTRIQDISKHEAFRQIHVLNRSTKPLMEKKRDLNPDQQRQIEKALEDLARAERDNRFHWELVQIDHQLKEKEASRHHHYHGHGHKKRDHHRHRHRLFITESGRGRDQKKRLYERTSLTAFYKRSPKPEVNPFQLRGEREMQLNMPMQHMQAILDQHHRQQQQQQQQHHQQQQQHHHQQHHGAPPPPPGHHPGHVPPPPPGHARPFLPPGDNQGQGHAKHNGKDHPRGLHQSSSGSDSDSNCSEEGFWSGDEDSRTTQTTSSSDHKRKKKGKRYLEPLGPGHFGVQPHTPHRRHSRHEDNYTFEPPRQVPPAPVPPRLLPVEIERIEADAYAAGVADGEIGGYEDGKVDGRLEEREVRLSRTRLPASRPRRLPPQIHQSRPVGVRIVTPSHVGRERELEYLERFGDLRLDDRPLRRLDDEWRTDEVRYFDDHDTDPLRDEPRGYRPFPPRYRMDDEIVVLEDLDRDRDFERRSFVRRRESSPAVPLVNPFTPHPRRASVPYRSQYYG